MSTDHRLDSAWFGAGAAIKQRGLGTSLTNGGLKQFDSLKLFSVLFKLSQLI
jgi:hypothetical protein